MRVSGLPGEGACDCKKLVGGGRGGHPAAWGPQAGWAAAPSRRSERWGLGGGEAGQLRAPEREGRLPGRVGQTPPEPAAHRAAFVWGTRSWPHGAAGGVHTGVFLCCALPLPPLPPHFFRKRLEVKTCVPSPDTELCHGRAWLAAEQGGQAQVAAPSRVDAGRGKARRQHGLLVPEGERWPEDSTASTRTVEEGGRSTVPRLGCELVETATSPVLTVTEHGMAQALQCEDRIEPAGDSPGVKPGAGQLRGRRAPLGKVPRGELASAPSRAAGLQSKLGSWAVTSCSQRWTTGPQGPFSSARCRAYRCLPCPKRGWKWFSKTQTRRWPDQAVEPVPCPVRRGALGAEQGRGRGKRRAQGQASSTPAGRCAAHARRGGPPARPTPAPAWPQTAAHPWWVHSSLTDLPAKRRQEPGQDKDPTAGPVTAGVGASRRSMGSALQPLPPHRRRPPFHPGVLPGEPLPPLRWH